jgi:hypothetical protein
MVYLYLSRRTSIDSVMRRGSLRYLLGCSLSGHHTGKFEFRQHFITGFAVTVGKSEISAWLVVSRYVLLRYAPLK